MTPYSHVQYQVQDRVVQGRAPSSDTLKVYHTAPCRNSLRSITALLSPAQVVAMQGVRNGIYVHFLSNNNSLVVIIVVKPDTGVDVRGALAAQQTRPIRLSALTGQAARHFQHAQANIGAGASTDPHAATA